MSTYTYKTKDGSTTGFVPGVGVIIDGIIESDKLLESPNLELANGTAPQAAPIVGTATQQNPQQPQTADEPVNTGVQL